MASKAIIPADATDGADAGDNRRRAPRFRVLLVARLVTTSGEHVVKLRDISASGAMIEGDRLPQVGADILLRRGDLELFATIVWRRGAAAGLEFEGPLSEAELWMQVNAPRAAFDGAIERGSDVIAPPAFQSGPEKRTHTSS